MVKIGLFGLFTALFLILISFVNAVTITDLKITDSLNPDLSMRETILIHLENNTNKEFKLVLPDIAYNITLNGTEFNNNTISEEIACENCSAEISYSFPGIVTNDSENYTFYRKIEMPINTSNLRYIIILPQNHSLFDITNLPSSVIPNPSSIIDNNTFEWYYDAAEYPKEFAVRYKELFTSELSNSEKKLIDADYSIHLIFAIILLIIVILVIVLRTLLKKKKH